MKKTLLLLMACFLSLTMSAEVQGVYYLLPNSQGWKGADVTNVYDNATISEQNPTLDKTGSDVNNQLKWEKPFGDKGDFSPERRAYEWFKDTYQGGVQKVLTYEDLRDGLSADVKVIWVNVDRNISSTNFDALFPDYVVNALAKFVKDGGNLFMSTCAVRLIDRMGRVVTYKPGFPENVGYSADNADWGVRIVKDKETHAAYYQMGETREWKENAWYKYQLITGAHADRNCLWGDWHVVEENAQLLGCWSNNGSEAGFGFAEFFPGKNPKNEVEWKGTIIAMGLAAYQWGYTGDSNGKLGNIKNLTKATLDYLNNKRIAPKKGDANRNMADLFTNEYNKSLTSFPTLHPDIEGWNPVYSTSDETVAVCQEGKLKFKKAGTVTLHVDITEDRELQAWPKGTYRTDCQVTFSYADPDALNKIVEADFPSDGRESGHSDRFSIMHANVRGLASSNFTIESGTGDLMGEAEFVQDGDYKRLVFTKAGKVLVRFTLNETGIVDTWPSGENAVKRYIEFAFDKNEPTSEDLHIDDDFYENAREGGVATGDFMVLHPSLRGTSATYTVTNGTGEAHVENGLREHDRLVFTEAGTATLHVHAQQVEKITKWPCGTYNFDKVITFAFDKTEPLQGWPTELDNAKVGQKVTLYNITEGLPVSYTFAPAEAASYDMEKHEVTFLKPGSVTITASVTEDSYTTKWAKRTYTYNKEVTVVAPTLTWSHQPDEAAVMEDDKPAVQATCDVAGLTVKYKSADSKYIEVNEISGAIKFMAPTEGEGIDITAYVTVGAEEFSISKKTRCFAPLADWTTRPATEAHVGDEMAIAGRVRYGAATLGFDCTGCTYSDGKLHFTTAGTATVRPYAEAYGVKYYNNEDVKPEEKGEAIEITVTYAQEHPEISMDEIPAKVWDLFPVTLPAKLGDFDVTYTIEGTSATLADRVLTYASEGSVELTAKYVESRIDAPWPADTYTNTKTITMSGYGEVASDADIAYLLPEPLDSLEAIEEKAEYNAAKWFMETYIGAGKKGKFVKDLTSLTGIKTLWINVERVGINKDTYSVLTNGEAVANFVKAGGNVLLTKQATRLAFTSGRMPLEPNFGAGEYFTDDGPDDGGQIRYRERSIATHMGTGASVDEDVDRSKHRLYNLMLYWDGQKNVYMVAPNVKKTNNYCGWQDLEKNTEKTGKADNTKILCLNDFEAAWNCEVLGVKGHIVDYCYADVVEFKSDDTWKGSIIAVGSSAYQWGESNRTSGANDAKEYRNVKQFTKNAIAYLHGDPLETETYVRTATVGNYSTICYPFEIQMVEGATVYDLVCMSQSGSSVILEEVDGSLKPGKSYIFMPEQNDVTFYYSGGCVEVIDPSNGMYGNILNDEIKVAANDNNYILYQNNMYYVNTENVYIQLYRAYINLTEVDGYKEPSTPEQAARRRSMGIQGAPSVTTGVANINDCDAKSVRKLMMDGALYIMCDGKMYNVQGQIVK